MRKNIDFQNRIVAFVDILGFKNLIKDSENDMSKLELIYKVLNFLKNREKIEEWDLKFVEIEEDAQRKGIENFKINEKIMVTAFSDSIVISIKIDDETKINELASTLISNLSHIGSILMRNNILIRGAITLGKLIHEENGTIAGSALIEAYELESNYANYPRIILSDRLITKLNYPYKSKQERYPYHQYLVRYDDGFVGFNQMIFYQVIQSWTGITEEKLKEELNEIKEVIIKGLDSSFQSPRIYEKYNWLKREYNKLYIDKNILPQIKDLNENIAGNNIHFSYTEEFYKKRRERE